MSARTVEQTPEIRLSSGSPRRASVLAQLGIPFDTLVPAIDETRREGESPEAVAERLAREKAAFGAGPGFLSFGFDTLVAHGGEVLGKPNDPAHAIRMIERLAGGEHVVYTGIAAATPDRIEGGVESTRVWFRTLGPGEAASYVETGEPLDKAGAYGIQGAGATLVRRIDGDFFNVMGFPIPRFLDLLRAFGLNYDFRGVTSIGEKS